MARGGPFFFFLLGTAAAVLGGASASAVVNTTTKESSVGGRLHVSSNRGPVVQEVMAKVGEDVMVELSNPSGTNYQWAYLGMQRQRDAVQVPEDTLDDDVIVLPGKKEMDGGDASTTRSLQSAYRMENYISYRPTPPTTTDDDDKNDNNNNNNNNVVAKENDEEEDGSPSPSLRGGVTEKAMMPGGMMTTTLKLPAMKEAGNYYHFLAFWSHGDDPTFRVVAVHVS